jgi:hypothetical protein
MKFLPAIPAGFARGKYLAHLQDAIETASAELMQRAETQAARLRD